MHLAVTMEYASSRGRTAASRTLQSVLAKFTAWDNTREQGHEAGSLLAKSAGS